MSTTAPGTSPGTTGTGGAGGAGGTGSAGGGSAGGGSAGGGRPAPPMLRIPRSAQPVPTPARLWSVQVPLWVLAAVMIAVLTVTLVAANAAGWMGTTGRGSSAEGGAGEGGGGEGSGGGRVAPTGADPAEIKGWMTLQQVLDAYPVSKDALYARFSIPGDAPTDLELRRVMEDLEGTTLEVPALRAWITEQVQSAGP